jgi:hypothetical protein
MQKSLTLSGKELYVLVEKRLSEEATKEEIFQELGPNDDFAKMLANIPYPKQKERYKGLNTILLFLVLIYTLERIVLAALTVRVHDLPMLLFFVYCLTPVIAIFLAIEVKRYRVGIYHVGAMLGVMALYYSVPKSEELFSQVNWTVWFVLNAPLIGSTVIIFFPSK